MASFTLLRNALCSKQLCSPLLRPLGISQISAMLDSSMQDPNCQRSHSFGYLSPVPFGCLLRNCRNSLNTQSRNTGKLKSLKDESLRLNAQHHVCHGVSAESNSVGVSEVPQNWVPIDCCGSLDIACSYWLPHSPVSLTLFFSFPPPESCSYKLPAPVFLSQVLLSGKSTHRHLPWLLVMMS